MELPSGPHSRLEALLKEPLTDIDRVSGHDGVTDRDSAGDHCDSSTGGDFEDALFEKISPKLALGLQRIPMKRAIAPNDLVSLWRTYKRTQAWSPDVIHSHGAKGGAYARLIGTLLRMSGSKVARLYCPHGGSIHYDAGSVGGKLYFFLERLLERMTDRLVFVSDYERSGYVDKVGPPRCATSLIYNGLAPEEYDPVGTREAPDDFIYIGMMRDLKGPDVFLQAMAKLNEESDRPYTASFVGDGPDKPNYISLINALGLENSVTVHDARPAREAFRDALVVVVPSRAESMPYIVLEAIAGQKPIVATRVGGIPEIFADETDRLVEPGNVAALAMEMRRVLELPERDKDARNRARKLKERFSVAVMAEAVEKAYRLSR